MTTRRQYLESEALAIQPRDRTQTIALRALSLTTIAVFSNLYAVQPILPVIGQEFGLQASEAGLTVSAVVVAIACSTIFYGYFSDKFGRRPIIVGSTLGLAVPTLLCSFAPNFLSLMLCRIGQGLLLPGFIAIAVTYIHEEFPEQRGRAIAQYSAASIIGGFTGRLQGGLMTDLANWRFAFFTFAVLNLVAGWALWRYLPASRHFSGRGRERNNTAQRLALSSFKACFKNRNLLGAYIVGPAIFFPFVGLFTYLPYYLTHPPFNLPNLLVSFVFVVYLIGVVAAPLSGRLSERIERAKIIACSLALMCFGIALTITPWLPLIIIGLVLICFGMFAAQSTTNAYIGGSVKPGESMGSAVSLYQMFFYIGGTLGGFVPGLLWQTGGWWLLALGCLLSLSIGIVATYTLCLAKN